MSVFSGIVLTLVLLVLLLLKALKALVVQLQASQGANADHVHPEKCQKWAR